MSIQNLFQTFPTQEQAVEYLEKVRWQGKPVCPYCRSGRVGRHASGDRAGHRWQCRDCTRAFAVTVGTLFHGTHVDLRKWFLVLALMLNANRSVSASQIARDLGMRRPTVWSMMQRIQKVMVEDPTQARLLYSIVWGDKADTGGSPRKDNKPADGKPHKRGPEMRRDSAMGVVRSGSNVAVQGADFNGLSFKRASKIIRHLVGSVDPVPLSLGTAA